MIQKDIAGCGYLRIFLNYLQEMRYGTENIQGIAFNLPVATDVKVLDNLKFMNLSHSQKLIRTPDFTGIPNLETLILEECTSLVEIHASVGFLKNLVSLNLKDCVNLKRLPDSIHLEKLETMRLSGCFKLEKFPKIAAPMACLLEVYAEATAIREVPSSIECLTNLRLIALSNCKHLASLPISICRLKGLKAVILSGCSKFEKLPDELGEMECLEELYCDKTSIQELPSSVSLLKKLKILSFRGYKPTSGFNSPLQKTCSFFLSRLRPVGAFQDIKASPFPSLSGFSSLERLDLSDCSMLDGGIILGDLGELRCLRVLNLSNNKFGCIPAESIVSLTRLLQLHLVGCERLQSLPKLPCSIIEVYADECGSLEGRNIDSLTKYPKLSRVSITKCPQLLEDQRYGHIVDAIWQHLLKGLSNDPNRSISVCFPGIVFPEWFTYKNWGNSLSVSLPQNWYNKFMGFAFCVVSNFIDNRASGKYCRGKHNLKSAELTCMSYKSFHSYYNPNEWKEWCQIEVSGYFDTVYTGIGMRLVYEDDVKTSDEPPMIQNNIVSTKYDYVMSDGDSVHFF
nr:TMV resistance protein N-like [Ipomoea batatas]